MATAQSEIEYWEDQWVAQIGRLATVKLAFNDAVTHDEREHWLYSWQSVLDDMSHTSSRLAALGVDAPCLQIEEDEFLAAI